jgi:hypothetical protein
VVLAGLAVARSECRWTGIWRGITLQGMANIDYVAMDTGVSFGKALFEYLVQRQRRF